MIILVKVSILRGFQAITMSRLNLLPKINISLVSSYLEVRSVKHPWCPLRVTRLLELLKRYSSFHGGAPQSVNNYPQNCQSPHFPTSLYLSLPGLHIIGRPLHVTHQYTGVEAPFK